MLEEKLQDIPLVGEAELARVTSPENPFWLDTVMVELVELPESVASPPGLDVTMKSSTVYVS